MPAPPPAQDVANNSCQLLVVTDASGRKALIRLDGRHILQIANEGDERVHYRFGDNTVNALKFSAGIGDAVVTAGTTVNVPIPKGVTDIAFITDQNTSDVTFQCVG